MNWIWVRLPLSLVIGVRVRRSFLQRPLIEGHFGRLERKEQFC